MKLLFLDFEASSLDAKTALPIDVGAILCNETFGVEATLSQLMWDPTDPPLAQEIIEVTGITDEELKANGKPRADVFCDKLLPMVGEADILVMHNASYDGTILRSTSDRLGLIVRPREELCTLTNFNWPKKFRCHKLGHLGWEHGLDFPANMLHRALPDCRLLVELLGLYDLESVLAYAREPWIFIKADVSYNTKDDAKKFGFSWETIRYGYSETKFEKTWCKRIKQSAFEDLKEQILSSPAPFRISEIYPNPA